jgi:hypothetical protein
MPGVFLDLAYLELGERMAATSPARTTRAPHHGPAGEAAVRPSVDITLLRCARQFLRQ